MSAPIFLVRGRRDQRFWCLRRENTGRFGRSRSRDSRPPHTELPDGGEGVGRVVCVFSQREGTLGRLVGLCDAGCRVLSVSATELRDTFKAAVFRFRV